MACRHRPAVSRLNPISNMRRSPFLRSLSLAVLTALGVACFAAEPARISFENDIEPLLARFSCNTSGCHGKAEGQNGFKLSVFGFDPDADYRAIVSEGRGR